jgi:nucleotide-binding universal stress UspA family protein/nitrite reductase/ring-hydroxylating ferredoxin subunit
VGGETVTYKKIVIGTDGSETAAVAQRAATTLAKEFGSELIVTHAVDPSGFDSRHAEEVLGTAVEWSLAEGAKAQGERRGGEPAEVLIRTARETDADLIVVGNRGMGQRAGRFITGGVPDRVSHESPTDLLIVRTETRADEAHEPGVYRRIVVGVDGSPTADEASRKAFDLTIMLGAKLALVNVGEPLLGNVVLKDTAERLGGRRVESFQMRGDPVKLICRTVEDQDADLVVVGNKGMAGGRRFAFGSVPDRISHESPRDVLIVKTTGKALAELLPGQGSLVLEGGRRLAAYRDEDGAYHVVSPRCTHMGCTVGWNDADHTWDCPCHGSRYDVDGNVLQGPAKDPLPPVQGYDTVVGA